MPFTQVQISPAASAVFSPIDPVPCIQRVEGEDRRRVADFMAAQFRQHFNATIADDTEEVYAIYGSDGGIDVAFGLNRDPQRFFSRHYVADIERQLLALYQMQPGGSGRYVEFAHLCVRNPRVLCRLVPMLARFLARTADYLICTATRELGRYFARKGLAPDKLADACVTALPRDLRGGWGTYYLHEPVVLSGSLQQACARLNGIPVALDAVRKDVRHVA